MWFCGLLDFKSFFKELLKKSDVIVELVHMCIVFKYNTNYINNSILSLPLEHGG